MNNPNQVLSPRDKIVQGIANTVLRFASDDYRTVLSAATQIGVEELWKKTRLAEKEAEAAAAELTAELTQ